MSQAPEKTPADAWERLRQLTPARVALGRTGTGLATAPLLAFELAHARARDAVHAAFDPGRITADLAPLAVIPVRSQATDRGIYLQRPDLGRRLDPAAAAGLAPGGYDIAFVIADGLSATAVHAHAAPTLRATLARLTGWNVAPIVVASQARVALGDDIGERLGARMVVVLIGERPGLSAPDSLGAYLTWGPRIGRRDNERNCISNVRPPDGLTHEQAADRLAWLLRAARRLQLSGVGLKEESGGVPPLP